MAGEHLKNTISVILLPDPPPVVFPADSQSSVAMDASPYLNDILVNICRIVTPRVVRELSKNSENMSACFFIVVVAITIMISLFSFQLIWDYLSC